MAKKDLMVLIPTKGRLDNVRRLDAALRESSENCTKFHYMFCVDNDDPQMEDVFNITPMMMWSFSGRLGPWLNYASERFQAHYNTIGFIGDDVMPRTDNWHEEIVANHSKNSMVYANDGHQGEGLPAAVFMDSGLIERRGYMVYPEFTHLYIDNHWKALGEALGTLKYLPHVYLEHLHPYAGKAEMDATYEAANSPDMYSKDGQIFERYVRDVLPAEIKRLK